MLQKLPATCIIVKGSSFMLSTTIVKYDNMPLLDQPAKDMAILVLCYGQEFWRLCRKITAKLNKVLVCK